MPVSSTPCVLVVADPGRVAELAQALGEPLPQGPIEVVVSAGGDDTIELFESRKPRVVVVTASLELGDSGSLMDALRGMVPRDEMMIVLVGDDDGPIRTALDAMDMKPDRFVSRPLAAKALRFAVGSALEHVARALGETVPTTAGPTDDTTPAFKSTIVDEVERTTQPIVSRASRPNGLQADGTSPSITPPSDEPNVQRAQTPLRGSGSSEERGQTPLRSSDEPTVQRVQTPVRGSGPSPSENHDVAMSRAITATRGSGAADEPSTARAITAQRGSGPLPAAADSAPLVTRTPTPQRGSRPLPTITDPDNPFARPGTAPRVSQPVDGGEMPVISRAATRPVAPGATGSEPSVARAPTDRGTGIQRHEDQTALNVPRAPTDRGTGVGDPQATRAALRARWEALADSIGGEDDDLELDEETTEDPAPLPPVEIQPRKKGNTNPEFTPVPPVAPWRPGTTSEDRSSTRPSWPEGDAPDISPPPREPTLILNDEAPTRATPPPEAAPPIPVAAEPPEAVTRGQRWSTPVLLSELIDRSRDSSRELLANVAGADDLAGLDELDDEIIVGHPVHTPPPHVLRGGHLQALEDLVEPVPPPPEPPPRPSEERIGGRDFARQLRAKMSMMAQRLFQSDTASQSAVDIRPRHDHHTEIDLASLGEEPALDRGVTEIERAHAASDPGPQLATSPGSWDTQVRERGLPDSGEIVRGVSDCSMILARMFAMNFTGRVGFRKDDVEKVVYFDAGRPVFASSNEPGDRMGELLVREGKITASQYERCQVVVAQSGRRMGEILVDFGYLKRRELLPAVRRHVEDIIYSLFGWDRGHYHVTAEPTASAERIRLSRHPASLVLEGIRRKLDRSTLEKVLGPSSTVIEVPDRERLGGILNTGDLAQDERSALAAFDGQADLAHVARTSGVDIADVLPLAWGLCVLGLATARRAETEIEESTALVGETDLAIDRERVHARWQLVSEADYFALLGVRRDATAFEIRRAYQAARRDFAADCFPSDLRRELARELEDIASVLDEAFRVLRDDRLRQTYLANLIE